MQLDPEIMAAIIAEPDDDVHRVVAEQWFSDHGEHDRAEFIALQLKLADKKTPPHDPRPHMVSHPASFSLVWSDAFQAGCPRCELERRQQSILYGAYPNGPASDSNSTQWVTATLGGEWWLGDEQVQWTWHRGFIAEITCAAQDWLTHADAITAAAPIERVTLTTWPDPEQLWEHWPDGRRRLFDVRLLAYYEDQPTRPMVAVLNEIWPRIQFTLPMPAWTNYTTIGDGELTVPNIEECRQIIQNMTRFIPPTLSPP